MPYLRAFFGLSFKSPSRTKLSAVATMDSSFERGAQPKVGQPDSHGCLFPSLIV